MGLLKNLARNSPAGARITAAQSFGEVGSVGLSFAFALVIGAVVGYWLDQKFGWSPKGVLIGCALGFAAGVRNVYLVVKKYWT